MHIFHARLCAGDGFSVSADFSCRSSRHLKDSLFSLFWRCFNLIMYWTVQGCIIKLNRVVFFFFFFSWSLLTFKILHGFRQAFQTELGMVYVLDRCVLDQLTAGAHEEKFQGMGVFSYSFRKFSGWKMLEVKHRWKTEKKSAACECCFWKVLYVQQERFTSILFSGKKASRCLLLTARKVRLDLLFIDSNCNSTW